MRILWIAPGFLHPTFGGGQIRTLGILRHLSQRHEIHFVAFEDPAQPEGPARAPEYSFRAYPFPLPAAYHRTMSLAAQLVGLLSRTPAAIRRYHSPELRTFVSGLLDQTHFDRVVLDFLVMAGSCPRPQHAVLCEHNVETVIWQRHAEYAPGLFAKLFYRRQASQMFSYERAACRAAGAVMAASARDADSIRTMFGAQRVSVVPTGVDAAWFAPPASSTPVADLVFVGAMDWAANQDGMLWFLEHILPQIRCRRPECTVAIVGRSPRPEMLRRTSQDPQLVVTGTVPDVRPYFWGAKVFLVPLRIGGGTRIKIYEAMAAGLPVVSTAVGAEGLEVNPGSDICIADDPAHFASQCLDLLADSDKRSRIGAAALQLVTANCSWERAAAAVEQVLAAAPACCSP